MRKLIACIATVVVILGVGALPQQIVTRLSKFSITTPQPYSYRPETTCNGVVVATEGIKLVLSDNVIIQELYYPDGSWVSSGDIIAVTETPMPQQTFLSQSINEASLGSLSQSELKGMASQYGFELPQLDDYTAGLLQSVTATQQAVAPISGIVRWGGATAGRFLPAGSQLCTIMGMDSYKAVVQVAADKAKDIKPGALAVITGGEIDDQVFSGTVSLVGNTITHGVSSGGYSSTVDVEIVIDAPPSSIRHGAGVNCTIYTGEEQTLLTLPYEAIHQDEKNHEFIYSVKGNSLHKQYIKTGMELDSCVEVVVGANYNTTVAIGNPDGQDARFILEG